MIDSALKFLLTEINGYLRARIGSNAGGVELGRLFDDGGKWVLPDDRIRVALVNVEEERTLKSQVPDTLFVNGRHVMVQPDVKLNLLVIFVANFKTYEIALQQISWILTFFQSHPGFTRDRYAGLDPRIEKLSAELQSLTYEQLNQVWGAIGGKQLPSVVYRLRLVAIQDEEPAAIQPPVTELTGTLHRA